jgi:hypothetical protein
MPRKHGTTQRVAPRCGGGYIRVVSSSTVDLQPLASNDSRGDAFEVLGIRVGVGAEDVRGLPITSASVDRSRGPLSIRGGKTHELVDGEEREITLEQSIDRAIALDGSVWVDRIAFRLRGGRVDRIVVRGPSLASLGPPEEVVDRVGPPEAVERAWGDVIHDYPARSLVIAWNARTRQMSFVALGADPYVEPCFGARDLVLELLDGWAALAPHRFCEPPNEGSSRVRYRRLAALALALDVHSVPELVDGGFLARRDVAVYDDLMRAIAQRAPGYDPARARFYAPGDVLYRHLLGYRRDVHEVIRATSGWLECGEAALLGMIATQDAIAKKLLDEMVPIERWLATLIDPMDRTFPLRVLIERFGWPDVDLEELSRDEA